jgi:hypothetical protein
MAEPTHLCSARPICPDAASSARLIAEHRLDRLETALNRRRIAEAFGLDVVREVRVEELGDGDADRGSGTSGGILGSRPATISARNFGSHTFSAVSFDVIGAVAR